MNKNLLKKYQSYFKNLGIELVKFNNEKEVINLLNKKYEIELLSRDILTFFFNFGIPKILNESNECFSFLSIQELENYDLPIQFRKNEVMFGNFFINAHLYSFQYHDENNSNIYVRELSLPLEPTLIFPNIFEYLNFYFEVPDEWDRVSKLGAP